LGIAIAAGVFAFVWSWGDGNLVVRLGRNETGKPGLNFYTVGLLSLFAVLVIWCATLALRRAFRRGPSHSKLRWPFAGCALGGVAGLALNGLFLHELSVLFPRINRVLINLGFGSVASSWFFAYIETAFFLTGVAAGAAVGWWLTRERAK
jgi:hypothetical protein